jgi:hypothetical protein
VEFTLGNDHVCGSPLHNFPAIGRPHDRVEPSRMVANISRCWGPFPPQSAGTKSRNCLGIYGKCTCHQLGTSDDVPARLLWATWVSQAKSCNNMIPNLLRLLFEVIFANIPPSHGINTFLQPFRALPQPSRPLYDRERSGLMSFDSRQRERVAFLGESCRPWYTWYLRQATWRIFGS